MTTPYSEYHSPPDDVDGVPVEPTGDPTEFVGELWVTLVPSYLDESGRVWEFSLTTGRLIQTYPMRKEIQL